MAVSSKGITPFTNKRRVPALLGADRQWDSNVERTATLQRLRKNTSDTLYRSVANCPSFSADAITWKEKLLKSPYFLTFSRTYVEFNIKVFARYERDWIRPIPSHSSPLMFCDASRFSAFNGFIFARDYYPRHTSPSLSTPSIDDYTITMII
ncbi:hypothetical protein TNCV_1756781 [Trichonephila clavipes]|nr:hypothetical protein TNCV_1756781 [Trichonephila clavipes]